MSKGQTTKVLRLEILKPKDGDWKTVGFMLRKIQEVTARSLNHVIREHYLVAAPIAEAAAQRGEKVRSRDVAANASHTAELGRKYGTVVNSGVYGQADRDAQQRWSNDWFRVLIRGDMSVPSYRFNCPIAVRGDHVRIWEKPNGEYVDRLVALKLRAKEDGRVPEDVFILHNNSFDESRKAIWDRLLCGDYKQGKVQVLWSERRRKWFVNISYSFTPDTSTELDANVAVGVDLGIAVPIYLAVNNGFGRAALREEGETITAFRAQLDRRRRALRRNERGILERRSGHGRRHKLESIEKLRELENNFRRTANHRLSRAVINFALRHHAGKIVMENLEGFRQEKIQERMGNEDNGKKGGSYFLEQWSTFELQTMIEQKAKEHGIAVSKVAAAHTSQRCSKCGHIAAENRKTQDRFECVKCGLKVNADYNAAKNLATPNIRELIDSVIGDGPRSSRRRSGRTARP